MQTINERQACIGLSKGVYEVSKQKGADFVVVTMQGVRKFVMYLKLVPVVKSKPVGAKVVTVPVEETGPVEETVPVEDVKKPLWNSKR